MNIKNKKRQKGWTSDKQEASVCQKLKHTWSLQEVDWVNLPIENGGRKVSLLHWFSIYGSSHIYILVTADEHPKFTKTRRTHIADRYLLAWKISTETSLDHTPDSAKRTEAREMFSLMTWLPCHSKILQKLLTYLIELP